MIGSNPVGNQSVKMIKNSFKSCAITTSTDGSEDDKIHCFQPSQPCSEGRTLLEQETAELSRPQTVITEDPFESDEDDDETNANEIVVDSDIGSSGEDDGDSEQESDEASDESDSS